MDVSPLRGPDELPFEPTPETREAIEDLLRLWAENSPELGLAMDDLLGAARSQRPEEWEWIRDYYIAGGWKKGMDDPGS